MVMFTFSVFDQKYIPFLDKFGSKFNSNSNIQDSMVVFCLTLEIPFLGKLGLKNRNFQVKLKFGTNL